MPPTIGICLGDITGIGPEVTVKALASMGPQAASECVVIGDLACLERWNQQLRLQLRFQPMSAALGADSVAVVETLAQPLEPTLPQGAAPAARAAVDWLRMGAGMCLDGRLRAMVTAPVNKHAIVQSGQPFVGQTEFLSALAGVDRTVMMLLGPDERGRWLRVALATTHVAMRRVADAVTGAKVELAIALAAQACRDLGLPRQRVGVCGLNPHAGEGGTLGAEEQTVIGPAVARLREQGLDVHGPVSADALFYYALRGDYDAVVAMYHDQGLAPLKMVCFENGVNWTLGLPFIRTSPDHGTAYDIAGKGAANPSSMIAALRLAQRLACG
jgi:4-hydroxythreonine-4-phosphate dehydrogenase